jgi:hemolysin III
MKEKTSHSEYTLGEEIANALSHGLGACLSLAALALLVAKTLRSAPQGMEASYLAGSLVFGVSLFVLYTASTLYHSLTKPTAKKVFGILDHSSIYLLIAGTYTAFCLTALRGPLGWTIFAIIWSMAATGIIFYTIFGSRIRTLSAISYIPMGLLIILAGRPLKASLLASSGSHGSWTLLMTGGACYIGGMVFYSMKKVRWTHPIWHLFVIAGSALHFFSFYTSF